MGLILKILLQVGPKLVSPWCKKTNKQTNTRDVLVEHGKITAKCEKNSKRKKHVEWSLSPKWPKCSLPLHPPPVVLVFLTQTPREPVRLSRENEDNYHVLGTTWCQVLGVYVHATLIYFHNLQGNSYSPHINKNIELLSGWTIIQTQVWLTQKPTSYMH